jgi:hypothetical protein
MTQLIHCIYASSAAPSFKEYDIPALLERARMANAECDLTGMLLYIDGSFFQVLEGEAAERSTRCTGKYCSTLVIPSSP